MNDHPTVVFVDDNAAFLGVVGDLLSASRMVAQVGMARSVSAINEHIPQLAVLDISMPNMNGMDRLAVMVSTSYVKHLPVIDEIALP
jgi:CheY-like chemotaxis protein